MNHSNNQPPPYWLRDIKYLGFHIRHRCDIQVVSRCLSFSGFTLYSIWGCKPKWIYAQRMYSQEKAIIPRNWFFMSFWSQKTDCDRWKKIMTHHIQVSHLQLCPRSCDTSTYHMRVPNTKHGRILPWHASRDTTSHHSLCLLIISSVFAFASAPWNCLWKRIVTPEEIWPISVKNFRGSKTSRGKVIWTKAIWKGSILWSHDAK